MKKRPAGITVIAILYFILAGLSLLWALLVLGVGGLSALVGSLFNAERLAAFGTTSGWTGFLGMISAAVQIVVAFGLLGMKRWAWYLALVGVVLNVLLGLGGMFRGSVYVLICGSLGLVLPVAILIYLLSRGVRSAFGIGAK
jgi:hypothetical protein